MIPMRPRRFKPSSRASVSVVDIPKPGGPPYRMSVFLIAMPAANGAWSVVAVSYGAL